MLTELNLGGVLFAPILAYALLAVPITLALRTLIWASGLSRLTWHLPLLEFALYICVLSLLVMLL